MAQSRRQSAPHPSISSRPIRLGGRGRRAASLSDRMPRATGTLLTIVLVLFAALHAAAPQGYALIAVVAVLQFSIEILIVRNYAAAVVVITPVALLASGAGMTGGAAGPVIRDRLLETLVGVVIGIVTLTGVGFKIAFMVTSVAQQWATSFHGLLSVLPFELFSIQTLTLLFTLIMTAVVCVLMGCGVPTTANYIIMVAVAAPVLGLMNVEPIVAHFFGTRSLRAVPRVHWACPGRSRPAVVAVARPAGRRRTIPRCSSRGRRTSSSLGNTGLWRRGTTRRAVSARPS